LNLYIHNIHTYASVSATIYTDVSFGVLVLVVLATVVAFEYEHAHAHGQEIPMALIRDNELQRTLSEFFDKL